MKQLSDCTVLIVDDEPVNLDVLSKTLSPHFKVEVASDGQAALDLVQANPPDLILLDIMMPDLDGYAVCDALKGNPSTSDIPIIFISALTEDKHEAKGFECGAVDYITKPFWPVVVRSRVETHLKLKMSQLELKELYDQTLLGSVRVLAAILALTNKTAFGQTNQIRRLSKAIAKDMGLPNQWRYDLAAQFSQLGCITVPSDELHNIYTQKGEVSDESRKLFDEHPSLAAELIGKIPRLEDVAIILAGQRTPYDPDSTAPMKFGCQILRTTVDFNGMLLKGMTEAEALSVLKGSLIPYNPDVVASLEKALSLDEESARVYELTPDKITPGMILEEDVYSSSGVFVAAKDMEVDDAVLKILQRLTRGGDDHFIRVRAPKE